MLFSEPKIPQPASRSAVLTSRPGFSALQRAENSSTESDPASARVAAAVSVLFSEPKIPQRLRRRLTRVRLRLSFSALQRAENSSTVHARIHRPRRRRFQCSSASRKFLNPRSSTTKYSSAASFSALQRAENSSTGDGVADRAGRGAEFQCSSASRKFLNEVL